MRISWDFDLSGFGQEIRLRLMAMAAVSAAGNPTLSQRARKDGPTAVCLECPRVTRLIALSRWRPIRDAVEHAQ